MSQEYSAIVLDNGSCSIKAGFSGCENPQVVFPSLIASPLKSKESENIKEIYLVGDEAKIDSRKNVMVRYPIEHGVVTNWEGMEQIWRHVFSQLQVDCENHPVLLTQPPCNPKQNREKMTEIMFETFRIPSMYVSIPAVLSLFATGRTTGIVLDSGDGATNIVPIFESHALEYAVRRLDWAGRDLDYYMSRILSERGFSFFTREEMDIVREIKEKLCYVALDFDKEMENTSNSLDVDYELPDGNILTIGNERFRCPEVFFKPHLIGIEEQGIHEVIINSIGKCDVDIGHLNLYGNVVLSGGSTMFTGIGKRLQKELSELAPYSMKISVVDSLGFDRKFLSWIGGSILSSMTAFQSDWIVSREYKEVGSSIVHRKCF
ncbi:hypothetical protein NAEGRDRAFT_72694 [Naegleria gruberi]|uniref:Actin n=1 Tax=Naegleria gruberi TaxID=5762 RepID=D2VUK3_NAEGR|nr:uncharacterized protein NAEGRDRAFT_72694 [Naegleria gruberi]EFC39465.1 hypothetical protein NAEGRDRAFT_72694 [Naegleria gruberi]|eukprot:XP_002672209.1 hypothetical protein NAEGRDRAFT_72694 [Naegleria gruberi strain NEG-M]